MRELVFDLAVICIGGLLTYIFNRIRVKVESSITLKQVEKDAVQAILEGMARAQTDLVREAKAAAEDGKLSKEEIRSAEQIAIDHAIGIAKGPAKDLLLSWSQDKLSSVIKQLLAGLRK